MTFKEYVFQHFAKMGYTLGAQQSVYNLIVSDNGMLEIYTKYYHTFTKTSSMKPMRYLNKTT